MKFYSNDKLNYLVIIVLLSVIDQLSKIYINTNFYKLLNKDFAILTLDFVRNYGAAFNMFSGSRVFLSLISVISAVILSYFIFIGENKRVNKYALSFILAGSIGNGIDRIFNGYVIDFIKIKTPILITISAILNTGKSIDLIFIKSIT